MANIENAKQRAQDTIALLHRVFESSQDAIRFHLLLGSGSGGGRRATRTTTSPAAAAAAAPSSSSGGSSARFLAPVRRVDGTDGFGQQQGGNNDDDDDHHDYDEDMIDAPHWVDCEATLVDSSISNSGSERDGESEENDDEVESFTVII